MKYANVLEVRTIDRSAPPTARTRAEQLLLRYPDTTDDENAEILNFLKKGKHLDVGLACSDERIRPKADAFRRDHRRAFRLTPTEVILFFALTAGPVAAMFYHYLG